MKIKTKVEGLEDSIAALKAFKYGVRTRLLRKIVTAGSSTLLKASKARAPRLSGLLRKSLGRKIKTYSPSGTVLAVIGPRSGFGKNVTFGPKGKKRTRYQDPIYYANLVEYGTKTAPAKPFMRPAYDESRAAIKGLMAQKATEEVAKEAAKAAAKAAKKAAK